MTVRKSLIAMMGLTSSRDLPDPPCAGANDLFWLITEEADGSIKSVLRPQWELDWATNDVGWVGEAIKKIRSNGCRWNPTVDAEELRCTEDSTISRAIQTAFSSWKDSYRKQKKPVDTQESVKTKRRRHGRKNTVGRVSKRDMSVSSNIISQKATNRKNYRSNIPELRKKKYNFIFQAAYQSSDESGEEEEQRRSVIDSNSDLESANHHGDRRQPKVTGKRKVVTNAPWKSRAPKYRIPKVRMYHN